MKPNKQNIRLWLLVIGFFLLGLFLMQFASCAPLRVVEKEVLRTHRDTLRIIDQRRDSIFQRDSVYLVERWAGDTLIREKTRQIVRYHDRLKTDTIIKIVEREATARQVVEKKKGWWEGLKANLSEVVLLLLLCFIGLFAISRKF